MRVLVLRHHEEDAPGLVGDAFTDRGATVDTHLYGPDDGTLPDVGGYDHLVVLGSSSSVYASERWIAAELDWLRRVPLPVLGICFGAQLLAAAYGGRVERSPVYEIGWVTIEPGSGHDAPVVGAGPWFQFHGDRCVPPPEARVLARNDVAVQAFALGPRLGVQFHPEIDVGQLQRWIEHGGGDDIVRAGKDPDALVAETAREEPAARLRAHELVEAYLAYTERVSS